jgi:multidrug efflux system outer membrane protein
LPAGVVDPAAPGNGSSPESTRSGSILRNYNVGVGFTGFELDLFGRLRSLSHAALEQYLGSEETRRSVQITLVAEVANTYVTVLADQTLIDITRQTLQNQSDSYALTKQMFDVGATTELALRQAETTVDTAKASLAQYTRQMAQDRDALQLVLGAPIPADIDFSAGLDRDAIVSEIKMEIPSTVLVQRPDVLAAERQLRAANADIGAARAAFFPTISLTGNFGTMSAALSGLFKNGSRSWAFAPQISIPIFTAGANSGNLRVAELTRDAAVAQYEKSIQVAFREVADALAARDTLDEQWAAQAALVTASKDAYRLADMRFHGGVDGYLSTLDAQRALYGAQQQLQSVRLLRLENRITFYKVLGGGMEENSATASAAGTAH